MEGMDGAGGRRVKTTISTSQFAAKRHRRRPTGDGDAHIRPAGRRQEQTEVVFVFEKPNINGMREGGRERGREVSDVEVCSGRKGEDG